MQAIYQAHFSYLYADRICNENRLDKNIGLYYLVLPLEQSTAHGKHEYNSFFN